MIEHYSLISGAYTLMFACMVVLMFLNARSLGHTIGLMDTPDGVRKLHDGAVPKIGGLTLCLPVVGLILIFLFMYDDAQSRLLFVLTCCVPFFTLGLADDRFNLSATIRLIISIVIAAIVLLSFPEVLDAIPIQSTVLDMNVAAPIIAVLIVISPHVVNLADGDHGIVPGILLIASALLLDVVQDPFLRTVLAVLTFGCVVLLAANVLGIVFLGSSGCYGVAALLLALAAAGSADSGGIKALAVYLAVLAVPLLDAFRVMIARVVDGRSPLDPDRSHLHHLLRDTFGWPNSTLVYWFLVMLPASFIVADGFSTLLFAMLCLLALLRLVTGERSPSQQTRLLFVVNSVSFFISHRLPIALEAKAQGYDVHVAAWNDVDAAVLEENAIDFHPIRLDPTGLNPIRDLISFFQIADLCRRLAPDVVHLVTIKPVLYGGLVARALGVRGVVAAVPGLGMVFTARGVVFALLRTIILGLYRLAINHPRCAVVVQNARDRELLIDLGVARSDRVHTVLGSGVCLRSFRPAPTTRDVPVVLLASRLIRQKGIEDFVEAARLCHAREIAARFVICGEPPSHHRTAVGTDELHAWCAEGSIEWWGFCDDMPPVFRSADVVCLPTHYPEGVPKVLLEAAAAGKPIVTTATPGCMDIVENRVNGFLVAPRDPEALAEALGMLLEDRELRERMGRLSRVIAENWFGVDKVIGATIDLYQALLDVPSVDGEPELAPVPSLPRRARLAA